MSEGQSPRLAPLDTTLVLETPEHVQFRYQLAGPGQRLIAYLIDLCVRAGIVVVAVLLLSLAWAGISVDDLLGVEAGMMLLLFFAVEWGYFVFFEGLSRGASPGKKAMGLRVIRQDGRPVSLGDSFLRNLLRAADLLPTCYIVGIVTMSLDARFRRLGDLVARTVVVHEPRTALNKRRDTTKASKVNLPLRPQLTQKERAALALFHRRASELSEARARELAELWTPALKARFGLAKVDPLVLLDALHTRISDT